MMPTTSRARNSIIRIVVTLAVFVLALAALLFVRASSLANTALGDGAIHIYDAHTMATTLVAKLSADAPSADGPVRVADRIRRSSRQADEIFGDEDAAALDAGEDAATDLSEQLTLEEAEAGAGRRIMEGEINDPQYPEDAWAKMEHVHRSLEGSKTTVHYWEHLATGLREGFKIK